MYNRPQNSGFTAAIEPRFNVWVQTNYTCDARLKKQQLNNNLRITSLQISVLDLVCFVFFSMHNLPLNSDATVAIEGIKARFNACQKFRYKLIEEYTSMWFKGCKKWKWVYEDLKNFGISCKFQF